LVWTLKYLTYRVYVATSSKRLGDKLVISPVNLNLDEELDCLVEVQGREVVGGVRRILTSRDVRDSNSFETPSRIIPKKEDVQIHDGKFTEKLQPHTLTVLELKIR